MNEGNILAKLMLVVLPLFIVGLFSSRRGKSSVARTTAWAMLISVMFWPAVVSFDFPALPPVDKLRITNLTIAFCLRAFHPRQILQTAPGHNFPRIILVVLIAGVFGTSMTNPEFFVYGPVVLPPLRLYDGVGMSAAMVLDIYLPFAIGQRVFRSERDFRDLLEVMVKCLFLYLPVIAWEWRFSPQLHMILYGFYPGDFIQHIRGGGFRPMAFMRHGLAVALFVFCGIAAILALRKPKPMLAASWGTIILTRSMGSTALAALMTVVSFLSRPRLANILILVCVSLVAFYPMLRATGALPVDDILQSIRDINEERSRSLEFRFINEEQLLERANLKPVFGWGGYGRGHIWDNDGRNLSVTDGFWIILINTYGRVGWAGFFLLLIVPLIRHLMNQKKYPASGRHMMSVFALMIAFMMVDMIPNAPFDTQALFYAGALFTLSERLTRSARKRRIANTVRPAALQPHRETTAQAA